VIFNGLWVGPVTKGTDNEKIIQRIEAESGVQNLTRVLGDQMAASDLQSLLMKVFQVRTKKISPGKLLSNYVKYQMLQPTTSDPITSARLDLLAYSLIPPGFKALELSPVAPLGSCTAVADIDQNRIVSAIRNNEVVADATNVLALECARRRQKILQADHRSSSPVKLCASHRLLRTQPVTDARFTPHFRIFCLCSAGRDQGSFRFEGLHLREHITFYLSFLKKCIAAKSDYQSIEVLLTDITQKRRNSIREKVIKPLQVKFPDLNISFYPQRQAALRYYQEVCFYVRIKDAAGKPYDVADGGFTHWTQQVLNNRKERILTSGIGTELLQRVLTLNI
jgi:hypothetical protein